LIFENLIGTLEMYKIKSTTQIMYLFIFMIKRTISYYHLVQNATEMILSVLDAHKEIISFQKFSMTTITYHFWEWIFF